MDLLSFLCLYLYGNIFLSKNKRYLSSNGMNETGRAFAVLWGANAAEEKAQSNERIQNIEG